MTDPLKASLRQAAEHLAKNDSVLAPVISRVGVCTITPHKHYYWELIDSIISQQLSVKAAAAIEGRFRALFNGERPEPTAILATSVEELRAIGLSRPKANYIRDLAQNILDGTVRFDKLPKQSNQEIVDELTKVKGIGEWTAHMFLIFSMGRLDVLPTGDLGIRNGIYMLYKIKSLPTPEEVTDIAVKNNWSPYQSVASWYIWQSLGNLPA